MNVAPSSSHSDIGPSEIQQALLFKKQVKLEEEQKTQLIESAHPADGSATSESGSAGKYLNVKA